MNFIQSESPERDADEIFYKAQSSLQVTLRRFNLFPFYQNSRIYKQITIILNLL